MQTAQEIQTQIRQIENEVSDIHKSLDRLTNTQDLLDAHQELKNRADVLDLLRRRLETTRAKEEQQAKLDARAQLEQERDAATAEHAELDSAFETEMLDGEAYILDLLDRLDPIAMKRNRCEARRSNAVFELRGRQIDWSNAGELSQGFGWYSNATPDARSAVRTVLYELYAARHGMPGRLKLDGQDSGHGSLLVPREPVKAEPDPDAFRAQVVAEYTAKNG